ncbi:MAG: glycoside hydrolase family 31 protein [Clostridiales bacterium]|nr:glycoside hydrolase family 31 protein [Clostridiales bacterium]
MNNVWKLCLGTPDPLSSLLALSGATLDPSRLSSDPCPLAAARIETERVRDRFVLRIPLSAGERLYGLGLSFEKMRVDYAARHLRCDHYAGRDTGRTHAPVPFYVSDAGYGVFVDTAEVASFYMGGTVRTDALNPPPELNRGRDDNWSCNQRAEFVEVSFVGTGADVYITRGDTMRDAVAAFNRLLGGGCLPPKWGLGFWHRLHIRADERAARDELAAFERHGLKIDVLGLEPGWQSGSYPCTFEWDRARFADPAQFVRDMAGQGVRVNLWENMYVSRSARIYRDLLPYCGSHQVWGGAVPDFTLEAAREIVLRQHREDHGGVSGYKIDECDGYDQWLWPDHARFPSGASATAIRNVYGARLQRMFYDDFRARGKRTYGLVRASNAGAASLPFCLYNDCYSFGQYLTGMATAGFCGCLWVPEIRDASSAEEWVRRFQLGALSPMLMLNAWANGAKPWQYPEVESIIADTIRLRRALLPYLYTAFYRYHSEGIPPFRAPVMDDPTLTGREDASSGALDGTANPYELRAARDVTDQFLIGDALMAAPMLPGQTEREVVLPRGVWHDFYTGEALRGTVRYACPLERIPLFVKSGGIIPLLREDGTLEARCYGERGETTLYDDDGETFAFERGEYALIRLAFSRPPEGAPQSDVEITAHNFETAYKRVTFVPVG